MSIPTPPITAAQFELRARRAMSAHYGVELQPGSVPGIPKKFDLVSPDGMVVGDAKYYTLVGGERLARYGKLMNGVEFFYLDPQGDLTPLNGGGH